MLALFALSDPTRLRIIEMLAASGRLPVGEISKGFSISTPAISQHLKVLKKANLVRAEVNAQQRIYSLNPGGLDEIGQWAANIRKIWMDSFGALDKLLKEEMQKTKSKENVHD